MNIFQVSFSFPSQSFKTVLISAPYNKIIKYKGVLTMTDNKFKKKISAIMLSAVITASTVSAALAEVKAYVPYENDSNISDEMEDENNNKYSS